ncbi:MAG: DUF308 domain-containing protein [Veillonella sp.]|uniref:DUF308 domain-containing protein n=1 Tax=Veillonella sp. TaxID=1926307 RepID=UPI00290D51A8|nr:DUF308 domain-containing protein [Veillonella sp.]MDU3603492.1 DUF308 domain-containing protein [Veillonella sp.]
MSGSSKFFFILSGIVSIILGIFLLLNPFTNLIAFAWLFSIIFFVNAVSSIINYFMLPAELRSGWYLISGIINALFGIYLISGGFAFLPLVLPITIGIWMVIDAIIIFIKSRNADSMVSLLGGSAKWLALILLLLGLLLIFEPIAFGEAFIYFIAFGFLFDGIYSIGEAFKK